LNEGLLLPISTLDKEVLCLQLFSGNNFGFTKCIAAQQFTCHGLLPERGSQAIVVSGKQERSNCLS
jgi:hypothetical protein